MEVRFYRTARGTAPVLDFLGAQTTAHRAAILRALELIELHGLEAPGLSFRQIEGKLWELRVMSAGSSRVFYVTIAEEMFLLHAYAKRSPKAPKREVQTARKRMKEVQG